MATKQYYYIDIDIQKMIVVGYGISDTATLTGDTKPPHIHRIFLTKGQYNKLVSKLK